MIDYVGRSNHRTSCKCFQDLLRRFQQSDKYQLNHTYVSTWTRSKHIGSSKSYQDRILCRILDRDRLRYPQFHIVSDMDHNLVTCTLYLDMVRRQGPSYWKMNASFPFRQVFQRAD